MIKHRIMLRQLGNSLLGSKDAPRPPLSNALGFVSFGLLPKSLRSHLWTVVFKKTTKYACMRVFSKKIQNVHHFDQAQRHGKLIYTTIYQLKRCAKISSFQRIMFRIIRTITGVSTLPFVDTLFEKKKHKKRTFCCF